MPIIRRVAANTPYVATTLGKPCPITLAARHHTVTSRREHELSCAAFDEQPRSQQSKAAQSTREEVRTIRERSRQMTGCGYLGNDDRLTSQEGITLHAVGVTEAAVIEQCLPLRPAQQWATLSHAIRISAFCKKPPAVCHAKGDLRKGRRSKELVDDKHTTRSKQLLAVVQRVAHKGCRVEHVGCDQKVARLRGEALPPRVGIDVEQRVEDERVGTKASTRGAEKDLAGLAKGRLDERGLSQTTL